jgi:type IV secretory pathway VirB4 component
MHRKFKHRILWVVPALALIACPQTSVHAQFTQQPQPGVGQGIPDASGHRPGDDNDPVNREMLEKLEKKRNEARQEEIVKDTNKLLALATELKADVDKTNKDTLSLDVIKKADEIEKLARTVKDRMKN